MKFEVTYTVKGFIVTFKDVVEVNDINECTDAIKKLVEQATGSKKSIHITMIKEIQK